ncbi:hypothetical protein Syun_003617 [Stephania yunnanensis]|uniref:EF-hand domain-containing protein n=1 Tax=Stephania yunnanensis TaxID=152371 RepID=A0AAP0Q0R5_9MAGN
MMRVGELDGNGFVELNEFVKMNTKEVGLKEEMEDLNKVFKFFDMDKNGSIFPKELQNLLRSVGDSCSVEYFLSWLKEKYAKTMRRYDVKAIVLTGESQIQLPF